MPQPSPPGPPCGGALRAGTPRGHSPMLAGSYSPLVLESSPPAAAGAARTPSSHSAEDKWINRLCSSRDKKYLFKLTSSRPIIDVKSALSFFVSVFAFPSSSISNSSPRKMIVWRSWGGGWDPALSIRPQRWPPAHAPSSATAMLG